MSEGGIPDRRAADRRNHHANMPRSAPHSIEGPSTMEPVGSERQAKTRREQRRSIIRPGVDGGVASSLAGLSRQDEGSSWRLSSRCPPGRPRGALQYLKSSFRHVCMYTERLVRVRSLATRVDLMSNSFSQFLGGGSAGIPRLLVPMSSELGPVSASAWQGYPHRRRDLLSPHPSASLFGYNKLCIPGFPDLGTGPVSCASPQTTGACRTRSTLAGVIMHLAKDRSCINSVLLCRNLSINISQRDSSSVACDLSGILHVRRPNYERGQDSNAWSLAKCYGQASPAVLGRTRQARHHAASRTQQARCALSACIEANQT